jgi:hypothetical protein
MPNGKQPELEAQQQPQRQPQLSCDICIQLARQNHIHQRVVCGSRRWFIGPLLLLPYRMWYTGTGHYCRQHN